MSEMIYISNNKNYLLTLTTVQILKIFVSVKVFTDEDMRALQMFMKLVNHREEVLNAAESSQPGLLFKCII